MAFSGKEPWTSTQIPALVGPWAQTWPSVLTQADASHCPRWQHRPPILVCSSPPWHFLLLFTVNEVLLLLIDFSITYVFTTVVPACPGHRAPGESMTLLTLGQRCGAQAGFHGCTMTHHTSFLLSLGSVLHFSQHSTANWIALSGTMLVSYLPLSQWTVRQQQWLLPLCRIY